MQLTFTCSASKVQNVQRIVMQHDARFAWNPYQIYGSTDWRVSVSTDHLPIPQSQAFDRALSRLLELKIKESVRKPKLKVRINKFFRSLKKRNNMDPSY